MDEALAQHQSDLAVSFRRLHDSFPVRSGQLVIPPQVTTANLRMYAGNIYLTTLVFFNSLKIIAYSSQNEQRANLGE
jgi:hypothetical protein